MTLLFELLLVEMWMLANLVRVFTPLLTDIVTSRYSSTLLK